METKKEVKKEKTVKKILSVKLTHPTKSFRLGSHVIGATKQSYELNEKELKELESAGCQAWLVEHKDK